MRKELNRDRRSREGLTLGGIGLLLVLESCVAVLLARYVPRLLQAYVAIKVLAINDQVFISRVCSAISQSS